MSSGAQIGGIIGGVIGFFAGGNVQLGYMIGSAIGGYVDPAKNYGPRLEDASSQTSTVGGVIPFGYGVFTTAGNVIWAADLVEHRKSERAGKGGGQKNYTYTYTRSYAVGVCKGAISAYLWVKRNGKLIYAADPQGLGAAMGWTGEQIADLVEASSKFRQIATLYYGTEQQMPDSTITAVEGVGNVAPHRGLAYIVLENDDVTDLRGAVGQFEFCVKVGAARSYTTPPYPVYVQDGLAPSSNLHSLSEMGVIADSMSVSAGFSDVTVIDYSYNKVILESEAFSVGVGITFATLVPSSVVVTTVNLESEKLTIGAGFVLAVENESIFPNVPDDKLNVSASFVSGEISDE